MVRMLAKGTDIYRRTLRRWAKSAGRRTQAASLPQSLPHNSLTMQRTLGPSPTLLQPPLASQSQGVVDQADGYVGEVEVADDVVVEHGGFQSVQADDVDQLVDAQ